MIEKLDMGKTKDKKKIYFKGTPARSVLILHRLQTYYK